MKVDIPFSTVFFGKNPRVKKAIANNWSEKMKVSLRSIIIFIFIRCERETETETERRKEGGEGDKLSCLLIVYMFNQVLFNTFFFVCFFDFPHFLEGKKKC